MWSSLKYSISLFFVKHSNNNKKRGRDKNMDAIHFIDYDKISDVLMYMDKDINLSFNVSLAYRTNNGNRNHFHKEYCYKSRYIDKDNVISLKRNFKYYLSIDVKDDFTNSVMINTTNILALRMRLKIVYNWFTTLFKYQDDKLIISGTWNDNILYLNQYSCLKFEPTVCMYEDGTYKEGVRIYINNDNLFFDMDIDRFMGFYYIIDSIDMYQAAITILNYIRPEYGTNITYLENGNYINNFYNDDYKQEKNKRSKGFFDNV